MRSSKGGSCCFDHKTMVVNRRCWVKEVIGIRIFRAWDLGGYHDGRKLAV